MKNKFHIDIIESLNEFLKKGNNNFKFNIYQKLMKMISENRDMSFISLFCLFEIIKSIGLRFELNGCAICNYHKNTTFVFSSLAHRTTWLRSDL